VRLLGILVFLCAAAATFGAPPDVAAIIRKLGERASDPVLSELRAAVAYDRSSRVDYLNDEHELKKQVTRLYRVAPENGRPVTRLISINGRPATERDEKKRSSIRETGDKSRSLALSEDLLGRYDFTFTGEQKLNGRRTWMLRFAPKADIDEDGFFDKLLNAMTGVIWVDVEEGQMAKAEFFLGKKISFFGGFAGAIERLDVTVVQRRVEPNLWLSEAAFIDFSGRKLFSAIRFRCYETCTGFRKAAEDLVLQTDRSPPAAN
jgi:hypothetical protein